MRAWFNMPTSEFVDQIRDIAIKANARPQVIAAIDDIIEAPTEDEIEERCEEARSEGISDGRDTQWEICFDILDAMLESIVGIGPERAAILELIAAIKPE